MVRARQALGEHYKVMALIGDGALTGGMAYSERFCEEISSYLKKLAPIYRFPGEEEMKSLAEGALRALESGHYQLYDPKEETA